MDIVISGQLKVQVGDNVEILNEGDSIYYDSSEPHDEWAVGGRECKFLTNNPRMKNVLDQCREQNVFPFEATLKCEKLRGSINSYYFE